MQAHLDLSQGQCILQHMGAHVIHDPRVDRATEPCGLCLIMAPSCQFFLKKGKGARGNLKIDQDRSHGCAVKVNFMYSITSESSASSSCSNVPVICPLCPKLAPAVWRYNLSYHFAWVHANAPIPHYEDTWQLSNFESFQMKEVWSKRQNTSVKRVKKVNALPLVISDAHWSKVPVMWVLFFLNSSYLWRLPSGLDSRDSPDRSSLVVGSIAQSFTQATTGNSTENIHIHDPTSHGLDHTVEFGFFTEQGSEGVIHNTKVSLIILLNV